MQRPKALHKGTTHNGQVKTNFLGCGNPMPSFWLPSFVSSLLPQLNVDSLSQINMPKGNASVRAPITKKLLHVANAYLRHKMHSAERVQAKWIIEMQHHSDLQRKDPFDSIITFQKPFLAGGSNNVSRHHGCAVGRGILD